MTTTSFITSVALVAAVAGCYDEPRVDLHASREGDPTVEVFVCSPTMLNDCVPGVEGTSPLADKTTAEIWLSADPSLAQFTVQLLKSAGSTSVCLHVMNGSSTLQRDVVVDAAGGVTWSCPDGDQCEVPYFTTASSTDDCPIQP